MKDDFGGYKMTLTIHVYYKDDGDSAIKFAREMLDSGLVEEIRNQKGNLKYEYFLPIEKEGTILLIDQWINQETLDKHYQSKTMQKILDLRKKYHLQMQVERYIEDDSGMPESDKSFIDTGN
ncbi:antibiotic biosynthesis monooxygenase [Streptococcus pneumoniae]|nr:monooxygenase [Streptococcus pneumoniae A026]KAA3418341.1 antibiotic biosynthesis monooxygenase [Streptococcus pneumoniae]KAA3418870.1 antibiotic biosynthesis monooxygenase [Streptococcus pneumoniae]KAA3431976.1 antibiotic biosynthesis monooxygenase [Streptococcus pneumoniae]ONM65328.1 antibiotic biosynthesis monooxygenase [Streptococcus pneumoniae]